MTDQPTQPKRGVIRARASIISDKDGVRIWCTEEGCNAEIIAGRVVCEMCKQIEQEEKAAVFGARQEDTAP